MPPADPFRGTTTTPDPATPRLQRDPFAKDPEFAVKETQIPGSVTRGPRRHGPLAAGLSGSTEAPSRQGSLLAGEETEPIPMPVTEPASPAATEADEAPRVISLIDRMSLNELEAYDDSSLDLELLSDEH